MGPRSCRSLGSSGARRVRCLCECGFFGVARGEKDRRERFDASGTLGRGETETEESGAGDGRSGLFEILPRFMGKRGEEVAALSHVCISWPAGFGPLVSWISEFLRICMKIWLFSCSFSVSHGFVVDLWRRCSQQRAENVTINIVRSVVRVWLYIYNTRSSAPRRKFNLK